MTMPQCCYLAKGVKRPSHTTNMQPFQLSLFTFGTQLSAFGKFVKIICLGLNCRGTQLTLFAFGTQFVLGLNLFWDSICFGTQSLPHQILRFSTVSKQKIFRQNEFQLYELVYYLFSYSYYSYCSVCADKNQGIALKNLQNFAGNLGLICLMVLQPNCKEVLINTRRIRDAA